MSPKREALPITIDGTTYDVSAWVNHHPGGADIIENYRNRDATDVFMVMHSHDALNKLKRMPVMEPTSPRSPKTPNDEVAEVPHLVIATIMSIPFSQPHALALAQRSF